MARNKGERNKDQQKNVFRTLEIKQICQISKEL